MRTLVVGLLVLVAASPAWANEIRCEIEAKYACNVSGCRENAITTWNLIDLDALRFSRCDQKGCDHYTITTSVSGIFINIEVPGHGMLARVSQDGSQYVEVVTLGTDVLVSYGSCR